MLSSELWQRGLMGHFYGWEGLMSWLMGTKHRLYSSLHRIVPTRDLEADATCFHFASWNPSVGSQPIVARCSIEGCYSQRPMRLQGRNCCFRKMRHFDAHFQEHSGSDRISFCLLRGVFNKSKWLRLGMDPSDWKMGGWGKSHKTRGFSFLPVSSRSEVWRSSLPNYPKKRLTKLPPTRKSGCARFYACLTFFSSNTLRALRQR